MVTSLSTALDAIPEDGLLATAAADGQQQAVAEQRHSEGQAAAAAAEAAPSEATPCSPVYHQPPDVAQARLSCSVPHPGALCCTKTSISEADGFFVVTASTTARYGLLTCCCC